MKLALAFLACLLFVSCESTLAPGASPEPGRIVARPSDAAEGCEAGETRIDLSSGPGAFLYVPDSATGPAVPLVVFLHGAGGTADRMLEYVRPVADRYGFILLVPKSEGTTWDGIRGTPGVDAAHLDEALHQTFARCGVDRRRLAVGGFSDGASYALTLGAANGDLFSHVLAFSPCGISKEIGLHGRPRIFISHGRGDEVLPFDRCGPRIAAALERAGYEVRFREFAGKHEIPDAIGSDAFTWFTSGR